MTTINATVDVVVTIKATSTVVYDPTKLHLQITNGSVTSLVHTPIVTANRPTSADTITFSTVPVSLGYNRTKVALAANADLDVYGTVEVIASGSIRRVTNEITLELGV